MALHGGIITRRPLCYTADGRLIIAPCGSDIRVYSAKSGEHLATLRGHTAEVTAVAEDASSNKLLLSASRDGTLRQWDIQEGVVLQTWAVGGPIESMVYSHPAGVAYLSISHKGGQSGRVVPYLLPSGTEGGGKVKTSGPCRLVLSPSGRHVATIDRHSCFVWAAGASATGRRAKPLNLPHTKPYTCVAFDPSDSTLALGDASGRILLWHNYAQALGSWAASAATTAAAGAGAAAGAAEAAAGSGGSGSGGSGGGALPPCTTVHWHASAVGAVCFSLDGAYLYSGGQEGVLVRWALSNASRTYLPRLGGPIRAIATSAADPSRLLLAHSDNTVRLINTAAWRVEASIHGLRPPPPAAALAAAGYGASCAAAASSPGGVVVQPGSGHVVLPAAHATLQFFDMARDRHVARLQVCPRNPVLTAGPASQAAAAAAAVGLALPPPLTPSVVLAAFSGDGSSLITVDVRPSTSALGGAAESTLRFWDAVAGSQVAGAAAPYALNTAADSPHSGIVSGLAVHPSLPLAVTTGREGEFRTWARSSQAGGGAKRGGGGGGQAGGRWRCAAVGGYKGLPLSCCAFSGDGSLLGIGAGASLTLWDPQDVALLTTLVAPPEVAAAGHELRQVAFLTGSPHVVGLLGGGSPAAAMAAVVTATAVTPQPQQQQRLGQAVGGCFGNAVVVWNLLTQAVAWFAALPVCSIAADPAHPVFAVGVPALLRSGSSNGGSSNSSEPQGDAQTGSQQQPQQQEQGGEQQQQDPQQQQQQQQLQRQKQQQPQPEAVQGLVLVFGPNSPDPLYASPVPGSSPGSLLFAPQAGTAAAAVVNSGASQPPPVSPLLLLTDERRYGRLTLGQAAAAAAAAGAGRGGGGQAAAGAEQQQPGADVPSGTRAALEAEAAAGRDVSALEAMFGRVEPQPPAGPAAAAAGDGRDAAAEAAAVKAAVAALFDAPSHALPAPSALCPTLLELLTGARGGGGWQ